MRDSRGPILYLVFFLLIIGPGCTHQSKEIHPIRKCSLEPKIIPEVASRETIEETLVDSTHADLHSYFEGLQYRALGNYEKAIQLFNRFLTENPDHLYSDRAQYLIVDSFYMAHEYQSAIVASYQMEKQYPESRKLPEAIYKRALAHFEMGQNKQGIDTLNAIIQEFPKSAVSELVRDKIKGINPIGEKT